MHLRCLFLVTLACSQSLAHSASADEPSADDLIRLAPNITSSDEKVKSIDLSGYCNDDDGNTILKFRAIYRAPDRHALLLTDGTDGTDGTPISFVSDHKFLVYDPLNACVFYSPKDANAKTLIRAEDGLFRYDLRHSMNTDEPSIINLDIKSMFKSQSKGDEVIETGDGKYRLKRTSSSGNFYVFHIDRMSKTPYQRVELVKGQTNKVQFCVDRIVVDGLLGDDQFAFPSKERLAEQIPVRELTGDGILEAVGGLASWTRAFYARVMANYPELRDNPNLVNLYGLSNIDWEEMKRNDKRYSRAMRELLLIPQAKMP